MRATPCTWSGRPATLVGNAPGSFVPPVLVGGGSPSSTVVASLLAGTATSWPIRASESPTMSVRPGELTESGISWGGSRVSSTAEGGSPRECTGGLSTGWRPSTMPSYKRRFWGCLSGYGCAVNLLETVFEVVGGGLSIERRSRGGRGWCRWHVSDRPLDDTIYDSPGLCDFTLAELEAEAYADEWVAVKDGPEALEGFALAAPNTSAGWRLSSAAGPPRQIDMRVIRIPIFLQIYGPIGGSRHKRLAPGAGVAPPDAPVPGAGSGGPQADQEGRPRFRGPGRGALFPTASGSVRLLLQDRAGQGRQGPVVRDQPHRDVPEPGPGLGRAAAGEGGRMEGHPLTGGSCPSCWSGLASPHWHP